MTRTQTISHRTRPLQTRRLATALALFAGATAAGAVAGDTEPRFASLVADPIEARSGPAADKPVAVIWRRSGWPVEILDRKPGWLEVRDWEGTRGWVREWVVSRRRTAIVTGDASAHPAIRESERASSEVLAELEPGIVLSVLSCDGHVCSISVDHVHGYIDQDRIWGTAPGEIVKP